MQVVDHDAPRANILRGWPALNLAREVSTTRLMIAAEQTLADPFNAAVQRWQKLATEIAIIEARQVSYGCFPAVDRFWPIAEGRLLVSLPSKAAGQLIQQS